MKSLVSYSTIAPMPVVVFSGFWLQKLADNLKAEVVDLQQQKEMAREELRRAKKEIQTEKLKGAATVAATNIAESVGSLFGSNKVKTLERENTALHREVADHEETIEALQVCTSGSLFRRNGLCLPRKKTINCCLARKRNK